MIKKLLLSISIVLLFTSCESEFDKQLQHGKKLVEQEMSILYSQKNELITTTVSSKMLTDIQKELKSSAHLSGNERLFKLELEAYRSRNNSELTNTARLITKYP